MKLFKNGLALFLFAALFYIVFFITPFAQAQSKEELQGKISERNRNIAELEEEIKGFQNQIDSLGKDAASLKNTLASLDLSRKKIEANLAVTGNKIEATNLEIEELSIQIEDKSDRIEQGKRVISQSLSAIAQRDNDSLLETLMSRASLSEVWNETNELNTLQTGVRDRILELESIKVSLQDNKKKTEEKKAELVTLKNDLANQRKVLAETVKEKNSLLTSTKNTESNYKKILASKQAQKETFERELLEYESALRISIDPSKIPHSGSGVLAWPLDKIRITQYFGNTSFATANPQIYNGKGHGGVDFAASIGTPVKAALGGIVSGAANTDLVPGCYSYGKWIMVKHANGLSTLYAHLSLQTANVGDAVSAGQIIGYSGNTGAVTGPHLHFGVYATEGVRIAKFEGSINCKNATIPTADLRAYLNPLSYL